MGRPTPPHARAQGRPPSGSGSGACTHECPDRGVPGHVVPPPHRARRAAPRPRRDHDRLRRLGHAAALRQRARGTPRRPHPGRTVRPLPHGRDHRHRPAGRRDAGPRAGRLRLRAGRAARPLHHDLRRGRRHPGRPDRLPPARGRLPGRRQRLQRPAGAGRADRPRQGLRRRRHGRPRHLRADRRPGPGGHRDPGRDHRRRPARPEVLRDPPGPGRRPRRAARPDRLHRRGRLRDLLQPGRRRGGLAGADRRRRGPRPGPVRPVVPRHAAPGGRHAAVRARGSPPT